MCVCDCAIGHYLALCLLSVCATIQPNEQQMDVLTILPMAILTGKCNHNHVKCKCFLINGLYLGQISHLATAVHLPSFVRFFRLNFNVGLLLRDYL